MSKEYIKAQTPLPAYFPYPKFLLQMSLSHTARLTYVLLLDRMTLSQKNSWVDVQGRAYVLYPLAGLAEDLQSSISSVTRALRELEAARLIERRSSGFSKPNQIFLGVPRTAQKCTVEMVKNEQPDCSKVSNTIAQNCTSNQINKNNLRLNKINRTKEAYGRYRNVFLEDYSELEMEIAELDTLIEDLSAYMQSTGRKYADHAATLRSWSARKKRQQKPGAASRTIPTTRRKVYDGNDPDSDGQAYDDLCGTAGLCCRRWALYCGSCNTPKEAFFPNGKKLFGRDRHPAECRCRQATREKQEKEERARLHYEKVQRLKLQGFTDWAMQHWTFANDHGQNPQMQLAQRYVAHWPEMREKNVGLLLWGGVGTGKSFMAGCIANALMEQEVAVCMTNFARIMNELNNAFSGRNEVVDRLCDYPLLVIDDFGMERGTEYALEQIYNIIDSRYRSRKPLIVTTNLTLTELKNPQDTAHARIYDRLLELCTPIACTGPSMRKTIGQAKLDLLKTLLA